MNEQDQKLMQDLTTAKTRIATLEVQLANERNLRQLQKEAWAKQRTIDISNLRFYADMFKEHQWGTVVIHWGVFEQTLRDIADRIAIQQPQTDPAETDPAETDPAETDPAETGKVEAIQLYRLNRYRNGSRMAEGAKVKASSEAEAKVKAAKLFYEHGDEYKPWYPETFEVCEVIDIAAADLPKAADLTGSDPGFTGKQSTNEYVEQVRGRQSTSDAHIELMQLRSWKASASTLLADIGTARDAGMTPEDQIRYLGRDSAYVITDLWSRLATANSQIVELLRRESDSLGMDRISKKV